MTALRDLVFSRSEAQPRSLGRAIVTVAAIVVVLFAIDPRPVRPAIKAATDAHAWVSLALAVDASFCGKPGLVSWTFAPVTFAAATAVAPAASLRSVISAKTGSLDVYCGSVVNHHVNNENSLMLVMAALLRLAPNLSLASLGTELAWVRVALLCVVAIVASWSGASVALTAALLYVGWSVLAAIDYELSVYPFLCVLPPFMASLYTAALRPRHPMSVPARTGFAVCAGVLTALAVNMRTAYAPVYLVFFLTWLLMTMRAAGGDRLRGGGRWSLAVAFLVPAAAFVAAYGVVDRGIVRQLLPPPAATTVSFQHHPIAHPIVLGVAVPENDFARRMGIRWDDINGLELAQRIDPEATYLGPRYESALWRFYFRLWRRHPLEMCGVYWFKFLRTAQGLSSSIRVVGIVPGFSASRSRLADRLLQGLPLYSVAVLMTVFSLWAAARRGSRVLFLVGLLSVAACGVLLESTIIMTTFVGTYYSYLLFYFLFIPAAAAQIGLDRFAAVRGGAPARPAGSREADVA